METGPVEEGAELTGDVSTMGTGEGADDEVGGGGQHPEPCGDEVPQLTRHAMALYRVADDLADNETRPGGRGLRAGEDMQHEMGGPQSTSAPHHMPQLRRRPQPVRLREHSDRDLVTALATAGREDGTTRTGAHAQAEAVLLVTLAVVRLEGALHDGAPVALGGSS